MREIGDEEMRALMVLKATVDDPVISGTISQDCHSTKAGC